MNQSVAFKAHYIVASLSEFFHSWDAVINIFIKDLIFKDTCQFSFCRLFIKYRIHTQSTPKQYNHTHTHTQNTHTHLSIIPIIHVRASLVAQTVKSLPAMQETWIQFLSQEEPLEKGMATHSSIAWRIPWTEEPGMLQSMGSQRVGHDWVTNTSSM